jgi:tetratricopeptide (TPR) repeat protein
MVDEKSTSDSPVVAEPEPTAPELQPHQQVGRFIILGKLGAGGMGVVHSAFDPVLDRKVALKVIRPGGSAEKLRYQRERLSREAKAMARLSHPNVVTVHEAGIVNEQVFLAMELVDGQDLRAWLKARPRPWREVLRAFVAAGRGLAAAHAAGLVHRDFKPDNVLCARDGRVMVTDFGLVWHDPAEDTPVEPGLSPARATLTHSGSLMGTPIYMSPEQHMAKPVDARSDQFSFCVALYTALEERRPFPAETLDELMGKVLTGYPEPPRRMPAWLRPAVMRGLRREAAERFASMDELLVALGRDPAPRRRIALASVLVLGLAAGGIALAAGRHKADPCGAVAGRAVSVWSPDAAAKVRAAFLAGGQPYAADAADRVKRALDAYTSAWSTMRVEACTASAVRHEQSPALMDLRMMCLDRRMDAVDAVVGTLARGGPTVAEVGVPMALSLEPLDGCADAAALTATVPPPPAELRARVDALLLRLAFVRAEINAAPSKAALTEAEAITAEARQIPYPPLLATALDELGGAQMELRVDDKTAEATLEEAMRVAATAKDDRQLTRAITDLMFDLGSYAGRAQDALAMRLAAEVALLRSGNELAARGQLAYAIGVALRNVGKMAEAQPQIEEAAAALGKALGDGSYRVGRVLIALGRTLVDEGKFDEARDVFARVRAIYERTVGLDHPETGLLDEQRGTLLYKMGDYAGAEDAFRRSHEVLERAYGPEHPKAIGSLQDLTMIVGVQMRYDDARSLFERVLPLHEKVLGEDPDLGIILLNFAEVENGLEHWSQALPLLERAVRVIAKVVGPDHFIVATAELDHAVTLTGLGRLDEALALEQKYVPILRKAMGDTGDASDAAVKMVDTLLAMNRAADALPIAEEALRIAGGKEVPATSLARAGFAMARTLDALRREPERARELAHKAREAYAAHPVGEERSLAKVDAWLAGHQ